MWESEEIQKPTDYSGLIIGLILIPVFFLFRHFGNTDEGLNAFVCFAVNLLVIRIYWNLKTYVWFWIVVIVLMLLHIALILKIQWPHEWVPQIALLPIGLADLLIYIGAIKSVQHFIVKSSLSEDD
jgi:hypothetical protein